MAFFRVLASKFIQRWEAAVINEEICRSILKNLIFAARFAHHYHHTPIGITQHERDSITIGRTSHLGNSRSIVINQRRSLPFSHYAFRSLSAFPLFGLALLGTAMLSIRTVCLPPEAPNQARRLTLKTALTCSDQQDRVFAGSSDARQWVDDSVSSPHGGRDSWEIRVFGR